MHPLLLEIVPLMRQGHCCSQLLFLLVLRAQGKESPDALRGLRGLCHGLGQGVGPCGLLSGGAFVLSYLVHHDALTGQTKPPLSVLLEEYYEWFEDYTAPHGGQCCEQILDSLLADPQRVAAAGGKRNSSLCGELLVDCWEKLLSIAESHGLDVSEVQ